MPIACSMGIMAYNEEANIGLRTLLPSLDWRPRPFFWTWGVAALEAQGRLLSRLDYMKRRDHHVWEIAKTTKDFKARI